MRHGISRNKNTAQCMVVGCGGPVLYVNAISHQGGTRRGYCGKHKALAIAAVADWQADFCADGIERYESHAPTWRPMVDDSNGEHT